MLTEQERELKQLDLYERHRARMRERSRMASDAGRNIYPLPPVADPDAKARARESFRYFCERYFPKQFELNWSPDHLRAIEKIERATKYGGMFAFAMPRGSGKALALDTPLARAGGGYILMRDVYEGAALLDENGRPCRVTFATEVMRDRKCYRVSFDNGDSVVADAAHLWTVLDENDVETTITTEDVLKRLSSYSIRKAQNVVDPNAPTFETAPYLFGALLRGLFVGGKLRKENKEIVKRGLAERNLSYFGSICERRDFGNSVEIVPDFLNAGLSSTLIRNADRKTKAEFVLGFFDAARINNDKIGSFVPLDGTIYGDDVLETVATLGVDYRCSLSERLLYVERDDLFDVVLEERKRERIRFHNIQEIESVPVRCVQVDSPSKLYLCGKSNVPTHNTTLCETASLWAALYGFHKFVLVIGSEADAASEMFKSIKSEIDANEILAADFPEVCYPIAELNGSSNRAAGQHINGEKTLVKWNSNVVVLPTVQIGVDENGEKIYSPSSGCIIKYAGILGRIRGMKEKVGKTPYRPSLCVIDDPQTDESARSPKQIKDRMEVVKKTIVNLAGPGVTISVFCPCTVVEKNCLADQMLDRKKNPEWQGERFKALYEFPTNMELWKEYADIRARDFQEGGDGSVATEFYVAHRAEMDEGAKVAWPERKLESDVSGLQFLMNKYLFDKASFMSEFQQEPASVVSEDEQLTVGHIFDKLNNRPRLQVPLQCTKLTSFIDVQKNVLFYAVCGWTDDFDGYLLDYGTYPKQSRKIFDLQSLNPSLEHIYPSEAPESRLRLGLERLTELILGREYVREDKATMRIGKCLIDANWGNSTGIVYNFCRETPFAATVTPSHGRGYTAKDTPIPYMKRSAGEMHGHYWYYPNNRNSRAVRHVIYDTNYWKTFLMNRITTSVGTSGCFTFFGDDASEHELLAQHLTAEHWVATAGKNRVLYEWALKSGAYRNDWFDCLVGTCVAANELGCVRPEFSKYRYSPHRNVSFEELSRAANSAGAGRVEVEPEIENDPTGTENCISFADLARGLE